MQYSPSCLPEILQAITTTINANAHTITLLDQELGDGDHVINLQRGIDALLLQSDELSVLEWSAIWQQTGMILMTKMGGASGSLFGTLLTSMGKDATGKVLNQQNFADIFMQAVDAVKRRGKSNAGEKTMLDVLIPVADKLVELAPSSTSLKEVMQTIEQVAVAGAKSTCNMLATQGRASYLGERSLGHIDAGAQTSALMIVAVITVLSLAPA